MFVPSDQSQGLLETFITQLLVQRGLSTHTISAYKSDILFYLSVLSQKDIETPYANDRTMINDVLSAKMKGGCSRNSLVRLFVSMRIWHAFLYDQKILQSDIIKNIKSPRLLKKIPYCLSVDQVEDLLNAPPDSIKGYRDKALLELMYASGLRVSELISLTL